VYVFQVDEPIIICPFHKVECRRWQVKKNSVNHGKWFWKCPNYECKTFRWCVMERKGCNPNSPTVTRDSHDHDEPPPLISARTLLKQQQKGEVTSGSTSSSSSASSSGSTSSSSTTTATTTLPTSHRRPKCQHNFWQTANQILKDGMTIQFVDGFDHDAVTCGYAKNYVKKEHYGIVTKRIDQYVCEQVLVEISKDEVKFLASLGTVERKDDPDRPREVLNFAELNKYVKEVMCVMPNRRELRHLVNVGSVAGSIDIQSCYTNIPLHPSAQPYCCIYWNGKYYKFLKVPFGVQCAPAACQTLTRSFCGSDMEIVFLDDFLLMSAIEEKLRGRILEIQGKLDMAGLPVSLKKSILQPTTRLDYLGYSLDFTAHGVFNQPKKIQVLKDCVNQFISDNGAALENGALSNVSII
jgi:hypothetical protein